jgi:hypothetical protein
MKNDSGSLVRPRVWPRFGHLPFYFYKMLNGSSVIKAEDHAEECRAERTVTGAPKPGSFRATSDAETTEAKGNIHPTAPRHSLLLSSSSPCHGLITSECWRVGDTVEALRSSVARNALASAEAGGILPSHHSLRHLCCSSANQPKHRGGAFCCGACQLEHDGE